MAAFALAAFPLLGIERFLYGYIYHFPELFKGNCKSGVLANLLKKAEGKYFQVAKDLGIYIKVFQFGVIGFDLLFRFSTPVLSTGLLAAGFLLLMVGQILNAAVFNAIGVIGVYYGNQFGYEVPWCDGFPYNLGISDPQYWGVVLTVWGFYLMSAPDGNIFGGHFLVPWLETFWYIASMKLLEHTQHGTAVLRLLGLKGKEA
eukprot:TRINITY_DN6518_c0_g1_i3.p1 TRINITY_DN6518_c0_g1~~TRINITY_DN6518_c0_g1_i3.p1  ORF type:complete len:223 (-),score=53.97 TRINITY_DN6518_c0_g1_i3:505-1110(-)